MKHQVMNIRQLRQRAEMSVRALAAAMGVYAGEVNNWENEVYLPTVRQLPALAAVLGCSVDELYCEETEILPGDDINVPTMTLTELCSRMRELGIPVGQETVANEIEAGIYPFAHCVRNDEGRSCKRTFTIFTVPFERWVAERAVEV